MTKEEAIDYLKGYLDEEVYIEKCRNAHEMAIKALEQEPCEDAVSRQALYEWLDGWKEKNKYYHPHTKNEIIPICEVIDIIQSLPSVTPQPKVGHWKRVELGLFDSVSIRWECSECKKSDRFRSNFCFNCGAKMEREVEE